jgi:mono/diheme cytochrome c family protein
MRQSLLKKLVWIAPVVAALTLPGCTRDGRFNPVDMWNQSRYKPYEASEFFKDGTSSRPLPPGTVARGQLRTNEAVYAGTVGGKYVTTIPAAVWTDLNKDKAPGQWVGSKELLQRGQERFNIYCSPCHALDGRAQGIVVQRGFPPPPDYALGRLRDVPIGHFYDVITNGYGAMYSYADRVKPVDRWAIAAYIRYGLQPNYKDRPTKDVRDRRYTNIPAPKVSEESSEASPQTPAKAGNSH